MTDNSESKTAKLVTIVSDERRTVIPVGVNGVVKEYSLNKPISLEPWEREAVENSGFKLVVHEDDEAAAGAEGSALAAAAVDEDRTDPHPIPESQPVTEPGVLGTVETGVGATNEDGAPVLKGGDEPDPLHGEGNSGAQSGDDADAGNVGTENAEKPAEKAGDAAPEKPARKPRAAKKPAA